MAQSRGSGERRLALRKGHWSETKAAFFLRFKGYRIVARNFRVKSGEIDIIARKGDLVAFVEVKARNDPGTAVDAVGYQSMQRIRAAADAWLSRQADAAALSLRFDIVAIAPHRLPVHLEDAF
jgi:putative endonuclease